MTEQEIRQIKNVPILQAAEILDVRPEMLRLALQQKRVRFGFAVKGEGRYTYHISGKKLAEYAGGETA